MVYITVLAQFLQICIFIGPFSYFFRKADTMHSLAIDYNKKPKPRKQYYLVENKNNKKTVCIRKQKHQQILIIGLADYDL